MGRGVGVLGSVIFVLIRNGNMEVVGGSLSAWDVWARVV
jgi:hypothetical protein